MRKYIQTCETWSAIELSKDFHLDFQPLLFGFFIPSASNDRISKFSINDHAVIVQATQEYKYLLLAGPLTHTHLFKIILPLFLAHFFLIDYVNRPYNLMVAIVSTIQSAIRSSHFLVPCTWEALLWSYRDSFWHINRRLHVQGTWKRRRPSKSIKFKQSSTKSAGLWNYWKQRCN